MAASIKRFFCLKLQFQRPIGLTSSRVLWQTQYRSTDQRRPWCRSRSDGAGEDGTKLQLAKPGGAQKAKQKAAKLAELDSLGEKVDGELSVAARTVAESLPGDPHQTASDLLRQLQDHVALTDAQKQGQTPQQSISSLFGGAKIQRRPVTRRERRRRSVGVETMEESVEKRAFTRDSTIIDKIRKQRPLNVKLFEGTGLNIFTKKISQEVSKPSESLFDVLEEEERKKLVTMPPNNAYEEMIEWTKEGKLWKFPIDNEQGLDEEAKVGFYEHVFLEELIKDFPQKGPIRHFMELVIVGLSKNPYLTVQQKHDHIDWFRHYFSDKLQLVEELMRASQQ